MVSRDMHATIDIELINFGYNKDKGKAFEGSYIVKSMVLKVLISVLLFVNKFQYQYRLSISVISILISTDIIDITS